MIAQLVLAIVIGLVVAIFVDIVPSNGGDFDKLAIASASVLTLVFSLLPSLDLWSHELDPNLCDNELWPKFYTFLPNMIRQSLMVALVATCLSLAYASFSFGGLDGMHSKLFWTLLISCTCALSFMALLDEAFRVSVFGSCNNLMSLIEELQGDALPLTRLDVIMHSLLVDSMLVSEVVKPTTYLAGLTVEPDEHELRRVTDLWIRFAQTILSPSTLELPFAEDVLRIQLLALLSNNRMTTGKESKPKMFDWVQFDAAVGKEPLSVPFVRSLCIFVGGMGQALVLCKGSNLWAPNRSSVDEWILPPGFFVCAEWAMNSIAIAITSSTAPGGRPLADWKSTQLSILVPAALSSIHNFHRALSKFAEGPLSVRDRSVGKLLSVCDKAATRILSNLKLPRGVGDTNLHLNEECQLWIEGLVDAPALQKESGISQASRPLLLKAK